MKKFHHLLAVSFLLAGCGTSQVEAEAPKEDSDGSGASGRKSSGVSSHSEIGALDEADVKAAFNKSIDGMMGCFRKGISRIPYLSGQVKISVRVPAQGKVRVFMKESTLGDRETERCMLQVLAGRAWPAPIGGDEGIAENEFSFDPEEGIRAPVTWVASDAGKNVKNAVEALRDCRKTAKSGKLSATLYVETDGSVKAVGVAGEDPKAEEAADCVVSAVKGVKLNSPGSFAAKLTLTE